MYTRTIRRRLDQYLADTRIVLLSGPRQAGKTTLARQLAGRDMPFVSFDDVSQLAAARHDPKGFVRNLPRAVIDEIQRVPELLLPLKQSVDSDPRPGRFLLTGSANLLTVPQVADSLAGRMAGVQLYPLSQSELRGTSAGFLEHIFAGLPPAAGRHTHASELVDLVLAGGYPEALTRKSWLRRRDWYLDYVDAIIQRDIRDLADIERLRQMPRLLRILAHHSAQLINYSGIGSPVDLSHVTTRKYADIFEQVFLIRTLQPWHSNQLSRLIKTPKIHFIDSGLLAALRGTSPQKLGQDRHQMGPLLETFVFAELLKLASWADDRYDFFHFRDKDFNEVDIVLEDLQGRVVGIEVKASATVTARDFRGLERLAKDCGRRFVAGLVLADHDQVIPFGPKMWAAPIATLWSE